MDLYAKLVVDEAALRRLENAQANFREAMRNVALAMTETSDALHAIQTAFELKPTEDEE